MPSSLKSLTAVQKQTLTFLVATVTLLGLTGWLILDVNTRTAAVAAARQDLDRKENTARGLTPVTAEEQALWVQETEKFNAVLLSDQTAPELYTEITRLAGENQLDQRFGMTPEEKTVGDQNLTPEESRVQAVGVKRYVVLTLNFRGDYPNVSRFIGALSRLPRPIEYQTIDFRREVPQVEVNLVMHVYKREGA